MSVDGDVAGWAGEFPAALMAAGFALENIDWRLVTVSENAIYSIRGKNVPSMVMRLHRPGFREPSMIDSEVSWIHALASEKVISTPAPIPNAHGDLVTVFRNSAGEEQHAVMFELVEGARPGWEEFSGRFRELGALTAALHQHSRQWSRPAGFCRLTWTVDMITGSDTAWGDWSANVHLSDDDRAIIRAADAQARATISRYETTGSRVGLIHSDLHTGNMFLTESGLTVIDFDDCGFGWYMYDLACSLSPFESDPSAPELVRMWLEGYAERAGLDVEDVAAIPAFVLIRRIQLLAWMEARRGAETADLMGDDFVPDSVAMAKTYLAGTLLPPHQITPRTALIGR